MGQSKLNLSEKGQGKHKLSGNGNERKPLVDGHRSLYFGFHGTGRGNNRLRFGRASCNYAPVKVGLHHPPAV